MQCSEFLDRFSDFYDGDPGLSEVEDFEAHLEACASCRRYRDVVARGGEILRSLPAPRARGGFLSRIQHRVFHLEEEEAIRRGTGGSGMTAGTALAVAAFLVVAAWYPSLESDPPAVELPAIVVADPPAESSFDLSSPALTPDSALDPSGPTFQEGGLWTHSNSLLYQHSSLGRRYRDRGVVQAGLQ